MNLMVKRHIRRDKRFTSHSGCQNLKSSSLFFADDLLMLCHGDMVSASILRRCLDEFSMSFRLYPSVNKSNAFFSNIPTDVKEEIKLVMLFREDMSGLLNVFLGMPLSLGLLLGVIQRLTFGAAIYFLWQERNNKRVELRERSIDILFNVIFDFVRLKLMGLTLKGTPDVIKASKIGNLPVKSDKNGIPHWREQHKTFYGYARGLQSTHDVYSMKRILAVTWVEVMRKHGYGYLKEIVVRRADNNLYRFKEGNFPRLYINDIEDMLLLVVQNQLTNLPGDYISDFAIALRMINRLMRSDELYKFSDRTLTGLRTSLDDITRNILMEYLPKRRWSTLENKRAKIMIKTINKKVKERRMMRSLKKFVGGRDYVTDLRL
nr:RNA-directed DNA polymerase, eukaryota, reverse transcriptase zinc-binding domain protein [Tanacetum cinerariifolium]